MDALRSWCHHKRLLAHFAHEVQFALDATGSSCFLRRSLVQLQRRRVDDDLAVLQLGQLAQLFDGASGLGGATTGHQVHVLDLRRKVQGLGQQGREGRQGFGCGLGVL